MVDAPWLSPRVKSGAFFIFGQSRSQKAKSKIQNFYLFGFSFGVQAEKPVQRSGSLLTFTFLLFTYSVATTSGKGRLRKYSQANPAKPARIPIKLTTWAIRSGPNIKLSVRKPSIQKRPVL